MAINATILDVIIQLFKGKVSGNRLLCLGYSDMLVTEQQLVHLCGEDIISRIQFREDSESILRWHGLEGKVGRLAETRSLFLAMGIQVDFVDIVASRGMEIVLDLNQPAPPELMDSYDVIYDGGTMEHCFNVGQVMKNLHAMAHMSGYIVHVNPLNFFNHGFFNFNPTFYHDFYTQSGNRIASDFYALYGPVLASNVAALPAIKGGVATPDKSVILAVAQKTSSAAPGWPMQSKYLNNPSLKA